MNAEELIDLMLNPSSSYSLTRGEKAIRELCASRDSQALLVKELAEALEALLSTVEAGDNDDILVKNARAVLSRVRGEK